ncbi:MAG: BlaI/MecI/CopY family transcriptional regulator [Bacteroidia bacterium]|nr:BlaI/MecI/CopY family transcriptional regulator [Bacteroidia bacterium]
MSNKLLTELELRVMNILWDLKQAFVKDIISKWPEEPVPAYNTVSTIIRILEEKGFVDHEAFGRSHRYFARVKRGQYRSRLLNNVVENAFSGSLSSLVSTLVDNKEISDQELADLRNLIDQKLKS